MVQISQLSGTEDAWAISTVPLSTFHGNAQGPAKSAAATVPGLNGQGVFQAIQSASGGVKLGTNVVISGQAQADNAQDAQSMADALKLLASLAQLQASKEPALAAVAQSVQISSSGTTLSVSLSIPETTLERLWCTPTTPPRTSPCTRCRGPRYGCATRHRLRYSRQSHRVRGGAGGPSRDRSGSRPARRRPGPRRVGFGGDRRRVRDLGWHGVLGNTDEALFRPESLTGFARGSPHLAALWTAVEEMAMADRERLGTARLEWLSRLPLTETHGDLALVHASPATTWRAPGPEAADGELEATYGPLAKPLVVYGHVHRSFIRRAGAMTIANSGSVSLSYDGDPRAAYLLIDDGRPAIRRVAYDVEREIQALFASGLPHAAWMARMLRSAGPQMP